MIFGNVIGDSLAAANSSITAPVSAGERANIMGMFDGSGLDGGMSPMASPVSSNSMRPDMSATTANNLLADLGLGGQSYGGGGTLYADASNVTRPGVASDAGGAFRVEVGGVDWLRSKTIPPLADGTPVQESTDPKNSQLMVELPTGGAAPSIEGYQLQGTKSYSLVGTTSYFYAPGTPADAGGGDFVGPPSPNAAEGAAQSFDDATNQAITAGTYNAFSAIGGALSDGRFSDAWRYATFEPSAQARAAATERVYSTPSPEAVRISTMMASPGGAAAWGIARAVGASEHTQDGVLQSVALLGQAVGAGTNVYKQTLTAKAPPLFGVVTPPRSLVPPQGGGAANTVGVPVTRSANPLSPVLEFDAHGNEIVYRTMSEKQYEQMLNTNKLPPTTETSTAAAIDYSSSNYRGVTVRLTTAPGTSAQLQEIGIAAPGKATAAQFPDMPNRTGPWMEINARFKVEGGQTTTQLGQGKALEIFNNNLIKFELIPKEGR